MPFEVSFLYFLSTIALLAAGALFLVKWTQLVDGLREGEAGFALTRVITGVFVRLTVFQVVLVALATIFWAYPEVLPRGLIGLAVQLSYLVALLWGVRKVTQL